MLLATVMQGDGCRHHHLGGSDICYVVVLVRSYQPSQSSAHQSYHMLNHMFRLGLDSNLEQTLYRLCGILTRASSAVSTLIASHLACHRAEIEDVVSEHMVCMLKSSGPSVRRHQACLGRTLLVCDGALAGTCLGRGTEQLQGLADAPQMLSV